MLMLVRSLNLTSKCSEPPWDHKETLNEFSTAPALNVSLGPLDVFMAGKVGISTLMCAPTGYLRPDLHKYA